MILVDTGVIIDYLRTADPNLWTLFRQHPVAICGMLTVQTKKIEAKLLTDEKAQHNARAERASQSQRCRCRDFFS